MSITFTADRGADGWRTGCAFDLTVYPTWEAASAVADAHGHSCAGRDAWTREHDGLPDEQYWASWDAFREAHDGMNPDWCLGSGVVMPEPYHLDPSPDVNLAATNAERMLRTLGLVLDGTGDDLEPQVQAYGELAAEDFLGRVLVAESLVHADAGVPVSTSVGALGARETDCGWRPGYLQDRLSALRELAEWAKARNVPVRWA